MGTETITKVVLAKVNFDATLFAQHPSNLLAEALLGPGLYVTTSRGENISVWAIADTVRLQSDCSVMIGGYLARARDEVIVRLRMEDLTVETTVVQAALQERALFVFDPDSQLIVFEDASPQITPNMFCQQFAAICERAAPPVGNVHVLPQIQSYEDFRKEVLALDRIDRTIITLIRPNPNPSKVPDELHELLVSDPNSVESQIIMKGAADKGLKKGAKIISTVLEYVHRYREVEFTGERGGYHVHLSSNDAAIKRSVYHDGTDESKIQAFLNLLKGEKKRSQ